MLSIKENNHTFERLGFLPSFHWKLRQKIPSRSWIPGPDELCQQGL